MLRFVKKKLDQTSTWCKQRIIEHDCNNMMNISVTEGFTIVLVQTGNCYSENKGPIFIFWVNVLEHKL